MSFGEIENNKTWGINDTYKYRLHPCYENVNDKSTLEFWLIYFDDTEDESEDESEYESEYENESESESGVIDGDLQSTDILEDNIVPVPE